MTWTDFAQVLTAAGVFITAIGTYVNGRTIRKLEKHTNGMSQQLQDFAEARGKADGKAEEKANPT